MFLVEFYSFQFMQIVIQNSYQNVVYFPIELFDGENYDHNYRVYKKSSSSEFLATIMAYAYS